MFWNLNILVITTKHISRLVVSRSLFLSKVPFYMEKFVHLLFPHSNFTLTQPNVMKQYQNITVLIGIASLSPFLSYPFFVCYWTREHPSTYAISNYMSENFEIVISTALIFPCENLCYHLCNLNWIMLYVIIFFRCGIPVIIMGETGCGKTRLIKFMCSLQQPPGLEVQNMILMKVSF